MASLTHVHVLSMHNVLSLLAPALVAVVLWLYARRFTRRRLPHDPWTDASVIKTLGIYLRDSETIVVTKAWNKFDAVVVGRYSLLLDNLRMKVVLIRNTRVDASTGKRVQKNLEEYTSFTDFVYGIASTHGAMYMSISSPFELLTIVLKSENLPSLKTVDFVTAVGLALDINLGCQCSELGERAILSRFAVVLHTRVVILASPVCPAPSWTTRSMCTDDLEAAIRDGSLLVNRIVTVDGAAVEDLNVPTYDITTDVIASGVAVASGVRETDSRDGGFAMRFRPYVHIGPPINVSLMNGGFHKVCYTKYGEVSVTTAHNGQKTVNVHLYSGYSPEDYNYIGSIELAGLLPSPARSREFVVSISFQSNRYGAKFLTQVVDIKTGSRSAKTIDPMLKLSDTSGLSSDVVLYRS